MRSHWMITAFCSGGKTEWQTDESGGGIRGEGAATLPHLTEKACYRLALRPPVGPMRIPDLTRRLLEPLGVFSKLQE